MLVLWLLAILTIVFFGLGFTIKWLFAVAIVFFLLWLISAFAGGIRGLPRGPWW